MTHEDLISLARARHLASTGLGRRIRLAAGLSVSELAGAVEVPSATLWRWESGQSRPRADAARRWQAVLGELAQELDPQSAAELWEER
jgi:transcriptional regulator with XRE-family HTH domain